MTTPDLPILESPILPNGLSAPLQALWWLKKGGLAMGPEWHEAHSLCQAAEGDRAHDLVHVTLQLVDAHVPVLGHGPALDVIDRGIL